MKKSLFFAGAALLCFGTAAAAQQDGPMFRRVTQPLKSASLDLETGTITRGPALSNKGLPSFTTCSSMNNLDHSGFVGVDSGPGTANGPCEWIDAAVKNSGKSSYMTSFAFAYCSAAQDPSSGGIGGKARIGFRTGYVKGSVNAGGPTGTQAALFNLSGLPAWTGCSSFFGGFACYLINITFGTVPVCLPDGPVGWSYQFRDLGTDGVLAKTFPFLGCVQSCTGSGPDGLGMTDCIDQYCPAGNLLSTFTFGTSAGGGYFTSLSMDIREAQAIASQTVVCNTTNPSILTATNGIMGNLWKVTLDCSGSTSASSLAIIRVGFGPKPPPTPSVYGDILCPFTAGSGQNFFIPFVNPTGNVCLGPFPLPKDTQFYGACWCLQGFCGSSPKGFLSNALVQTMGSN
jgi:hypothetical protein